MNDTTGVSVDGSNVILDSTALNGKTGTISISSGDYKLSLAADVVTEAPDLGATFELSGNTAAYYTTRKGDYYSGSGTTSITYNPSVASNDSIVISGITDVSSLDVSGTGVTINVNAIADGGATLTKADASYSFTINGTREGTVPDKTFTLGDTVNNAVNNSSYHMKLVGNAQANTFTNSGYTVIIEGGAGDDTITNTSYDVKVDGGAGNDSIISSGNNVSINGGLGNDTINLTGGEGVTVNVNSGDDLISVGSAVTSFTVQDFKAGDLIKLTNAVDSLSIDSGKLKAGSVTVNGIDSVVTAQNDWSVGTGSIIYRGWTNN